MSKKLYEEIPTRFSEYYIKNYKILEDEFYDGIYSSIKKLMGIWNFTDYEVNTNSHFGLILHTTSKTKGKIVIKIIPPNTDRFICESNAYRMLNYPSICDIYSIDNNLGAIILKEIPNEKNLLLNYDITERLEKVIVLFEEVYANKKTATNEDMPKFIDYNKNFTKSIDEVITKHRNFSSDWGELKKYASVACRLIRSHFTLSEKYILHGDIHHNNIMCDKSKLKIIDPIGYIGDIIFEFTRFIGSELIITDEKEIQKNIQIIMDKMQRINIDMDKLFIGIFIDSVLRAFNTFMEGTSPIHTREWLIVLRGIYHDMEINQYV